MHVNVYSLGLQFISSIKYLCEYSLFFCHCQHSYMCTGVCMYVIYVHKKHTYKHMYVHVYKFIYNTIHVCTKVYTHTHASVHTTHTQHIHTYIQVYTYIPLHPFIHAGIVTFISTPSRMILSFVEMPEPQSLLAHCIYFFFWLVDPDIM